MIIRPADLEKDALAIMEGARDFANRTPIKSLLTGNSFIEAVSRVLTLPGFEVLLAEYKGQVVGGIGILYGPLLWNSDFLTAEEHFWWTAKDAPFGTGKALMNQTMAIINIKDAIPMFKSLSTSHKGVDRIYRRFGMEPVETLYMRIPNGD